MEIQFTPDELRHPAPSVARRLVYAQLKVVIAAGERCTRKKRDALHDFRVAVRHLRTWLGGYESLLCDTVPKRITRKLSRLQEATNSARDLEVEYLWIKQQVRQYPELAKRKRTNRLLHDLRRQLRKKQATVNAAIRRKLPRIAKRLKRALSHHGVRVEASPSSEYSMGFATMQALLASSQELQDRVMRIISVDDVSHAHRARIAAKHLRYLLEPLRDSSQAAKRAIDHLTTIQDGIGELRDASALQSHIADFSKSPAFTKHAGARLHVAREQYRKLDIQAMVNQTRSEVSDVVVNLHAITSFTTTSP